MDIELSELKLITNRIFDHIQKDLNLEKISIDKDFYWDIDSDQLYDVNNEPTKVDVGQLYDDWEFLKSIADDEEQAVSLMLTHLAPILRYIGEKVGQ